MNTRFILAATAALTFSALPLSAQRNTNRRTADIRGGGGDGKCTIEVNVDDAAEVEIYGRNATIRTVSGGPAFFRRFQCNQELPTNPADFRFHGVDGRGRQELVRAPGGRGPAVVRIVDSGGGSESYTFDLTWRGGSGYNSGGYNSGGSNTRGYGSGYYNNRDAWDATGWGSGSGWSNGGSFNFNGGREGSGAFRDRNGDRRRLDQARVSISNSGYLTVNFNTDRGNLLLSGNVNRRDGRRIQAPVYGNGTRGNIEIEMSSRNEVRRITMREIDLDWRN